MSTSKPTKTKAKELLQKLVDTISDLKGLTTDSEQFTKWLRDTRVTIERIFPKVPFHLSDLGSISYHPPMSQPIVSRLMAPPPSAPNPKPFYLKGFGRAKTILESMIEEIETHWDDELSETANNKVHALETIQILCSRFHIVASQLRQRHDGRDTIDINDEYDVQDLLHSLLRIFFDDIRKEDYTPIYAGGASRVDFLLKKQQIIIEVKKTRATLKTKELGEQLIIDIARYQTHPNCNMLYCFVYDPEGYIKNPRGIENDLSSQDGLFQVEVLIVPK